MAAVLAVPRRSIAASRLSVLLRGRGVAVLVRGSGTRRGDRPTQCVDAWGTHSAWAVRFGTRSTGLGVNPPLAYSSRHFRSPRCRDFATAIVRYGCETSGSLLKRGRIQRHWPAASLEPTRVLKLPCVFTADVDDTMDNRAAGDARHRAAARPVRTRGQNALVACSIAIATTTAVRLAFARDLNR